MNFNQHSDLEGLHGIFSASKYSWLRYSDDKALNVYQNVKANEMGTILHKWAKDTIDLGIKQPRSKKTLYAYVNDAIGFKMKTEVVLFYSPIFFGTADTISFRDNVLRIHDLKTGTSKVSMDQLIIYASLFCLEYKIKPNDISIKLRIYQNDDAEYLDPEPEEIIYVMDKIVHLNKILMEYND